MKDITPKPKPGQIYLNIGSGVYVPRGWISVDKYITEEQIKDKKGFYRDAMWERGGKFVQADVLKLPFPDNYADYVLMDNIIEHIRFRDVINAIREPRRVMKKGATLRIITNNFDGLALDWMHMLNERVFDLQRYHRLSQEIYGNQAGDTEGEFHLTPFNPDFLNFVVVQAGFKDGKMGRVPKGVLYPQLGVVKLAKGSRARNEILWVDAVK